MEENKDLNRIKVMLAEKKRTNKWLAEQLGVNAATVSKWCTNSSQPSLDMLSKIAAALKMTHTRSCSLMPLRTKLFRYRRGWSSCSGN